MINKIENLDQHFPQILELYNAVGWAAYTDEPDSLKSALKNSSYLFGAFESGNLIGIIRGMSDKVSINYIQDILVVPNDHNKGIGTKLVNHIFEQFKNVRTHILLTDDEPSQLAFYKKLKMTNTIDSAEYPLNVFVKFKEND